MSQPLTIVTRCAKCGAVVDAMTEDEASQASRFLKEAVLWGYLAQQRHDEAEHPAPTA